MATRATRDLRATRIVDVVGGVCVGLAAARPSIQLAPAITIATRTCLESGRGWQQRDSWTPWRAGDHHDNKGGAEWVGGGRGLHAGHHPIGLHVGEVAPQVLLLLESLEQ